MTRIKPIITFDHGPGPSSRESEKKNILQLGKGGRLARLRRARRPSRLPRGAAVPRPHRSFFSTFYLSIYRLRFCLVLGPISPYVIYFHLTCNLLPNYNYFRPSVFPSSAKLACAGRWQRDQDRAARERKHRMKPDPGPTAGAPANFAFDRNTLGACRHHDVGRTSARPGACRAPRVVWGGPDLTLGLVAPNIPMSRHIYLP